MLSLQQLVEKHTTKHLVHAMGLGFLKWDTVNSLQSVWPQFYRRIVEVEPSLDFAQAHGLVYAGSAVMRVLLAHQERFYRSKKPKLSKRDMVYAVSWSNLDCGPMEGRWIPEDRILVVRE